MIEAISNKASIKAIKHNKPNSFPNHNHQVVLTKGELNKALYRDNCCIPKKLAVDLPRFAG